MSSHRAVVVGAAPSEGGVAHYRHLVRTADVLIAADGGVVLCLEAGRAPDVCVGDFDSAPLEALERAAQLGARIDRYPTDKDASDLDLAVVVARELSCDRVTLTAAFTGRPDHTLAAFGTLLSVADLSGEADEPTWTGYPLTADARPHCVLHEPNGTVLSLMALGGPAIVSACGVAFPLDRASIAPLSSLGLSNRASEDPQEFSIAEGSAVLIVSRNLPYVAL